MNTPSPRTILFLGALLIAAIASGFVVAELGEQDKEPTRPELSLAYYLDDAELTGTGQDGRMLYQVRTSRAAQSPDDDSIDLEGVEMVYGPPTALPWDVRANRGRIPADARVIELSGNVVAISATDEGDRTVIRTQRLDIDPATRQARTRQDVQIEFDGRVVNATGMQADFQTNQLKLLSNVHGKFVP